MKQTDLNTLVRANILRLTPYSCARDEYSGGNATIFLDANESPYNSPYNRYPDPLCRNLKRAVAQLKGVSEDSIFLGNGSDEAIDLILRIFCSPGRDNVVAIAPTYGMYEVCANINNVEYRPVPLDADTFSLNADRLLDAATSAPSRTKVIFLCSPNNPTGNSLDTAEVERVINRFDGIVVIDEAYIDFARQTSFRTKLDRYPNIIVLGTLSKAWASAAIRLGMAFASREIISLMNKVKYPYNVSLPGQQAALDILRRKADVDEWVRLILSERQRVTNEFRRLDSCRQLFPTDANFFLARMDGARDIYSYLVRRGIVVRDRSRVVLCGDCLRITVGTHGENDTLLEALKDYTK